MGARTTPPSSRVLVSNPERIAQRAEAIDSVRSLLTIGRSTVNAVAKHLGVPRATAYNYLRKMEGDG
jgi:predicted transcriptional regulator YheO